MKKILFTAISAISLAGAFAQTPFLTKTCYRGAFAPAPTPMWTDSWTEWDPKNKSYAAPTQTISANITSNTTFSASQVYLLQGQIYVSNNSVLTIEPGTLIRGLSGASGSGLFVTKGSQLIANGTATAPIVFTSDQAIGNRHEGDWGGVILMGKATNNNPGGVNNIEGIAPTALTEYGGGANSDDNDNSGSLKYVRIEFGGYVYTQNKEINGLTFGAVGRGTTIDYVQCSFTNDDSFEWFGGAVNCKHLVAYRGVDDDFDTDNGYHGTVQFCLGVRDPDYADPTYAAATSPSTSEAFESDNDASGSTNTPITSAIFSNVTDIGPLRGVVTATVHPGFRRGARIRRNSALKIVNSILIDHKTRAMFIDGQLSEQNAAGGSLVFKNNILAGYGQRATEQGTFNVINTNTFVIANQNDTLLSSANILANPYNYLTPDYRPAANSIALAGASFTDPAIAIATSTSAAQALATIPASFCIGSGSTINQTAVFVPATTITPEYCSLSWSVSPGVTISSTAAVNPSFSISTIGTFSVYLMVTDANGVHNVVNSVTTNTCLDVSVGSVKNTIGFVSVYPNPTKDMATVTINTPNALSLSAGVYDITGKLVMTAVQNQNLLAGENKFTIDTKDLNNGIYFVTLNTSNGKETVKLVVNK